MFDATVRESSYTEYSRWGALHSVKSYVHHLMYITGLRAVDNDEVALLTAPLVRLRLKKLSNGIVAHIPNARCPTEPFGLFQDSDVHLEATLFLMHFVDSGQPSSGNFSSSLCNRARLATACPTSTSPRAWVAVDSRTGHLSLTLVESCAAMFEIRRGSKPGEYNICCECNLGVFLSSGPKSATDGRVRVCSRENGRNEQFSISVIPIPLHAVHCLRESPSTSLFYSDDPNLSEVSQRLWILPVHIRSFPYDFTVESAPGVALKGTRKSGTGWDLFTLEFDSITRVARIRDSRGLYVTTDLSGDQLQARRTADDNEVRASKRVILADFVRLIFYFAVSSIFGERLIAEVLAALSYIAVHIELLFDLFLSRAASFFEGFTVPFMTQEDITGMIQEHMRKLANIEAARANSDDGTSGNCEMPIAGRFTVMFVDEANDCVSLQTKKGYLTARRNGFVGVSQRTVVGPCEKFVLQIALPSARNDNMPSVQLRHLPRGVREVDANIAVPASVDIVYKVLRDYDGFARFIKDCSGSRLVGRDERENCLFVEMSQSHSFLWLTITMKMTLKVTEDDKNRKVSLDMIRGFGVRLYKGVWHAMKVQDGRCMLRMTLSTAPQIPTPNFLLDGVLRHAISESLMQVRNECILRSTARGW